MKNYYEILEVNSKASKEVIENAYKVLSKKYKPDKYEGQEKIDAEKKIENITEAYHILSDEFLKEQYDKEIAKQGKSVYNTRSLESGRIIPKKVKDEQENITKEETPKRKHKVGSFMAMIDLLKDIYTNRPKTQGVKNLKREDILTIVIVVGLGIMLWFIPFTNGFIRSLNPFSK